MSTHILTAGGGGFSMSATGSPTAFDRYLVDLSPKKSPLVCFIPTAAADDPTYINKFLTAYGALGVRTMVLTLWQGASQAVERLPQADIVMVGGGSTVNLLALWKAHGVSDVLRTIAKSDKDIVFGGLSAGAACWFEGCLTDSFGPLRPWRGGLGILPGSFCPHFDSESDRASVYPDAIASEILPGGYAVDDHAAIHWIDGKIYKGICEQEGAAILHVTPSDQPTTSGVTSEALPTEFIGY